MRFIERLVGAFLVVLTGTLIGQDPDAATVAPQKLASIQERVDAVSRQEIEDTVRRLAAFGTRHTLSETQSTTRGIGAARQWLLERMTKNATGGAMTAALQSFIAEPGQRIPQPTELVNVIATLPGSDPKRFVIVSGHYDSMPSNVMDPKSDAPGSNDDASGTAVAVECARVLAGVRPRATILFAAVAGEEQGLVGAGYIAKEMARTESTVVMMITNDIVGGATGSNGRKDPMVLRCFSEGVPSGPKDDAGKPKKSVVGSDNDASSRQVARYLAARGPLYVPGFDVRMVFRQDRYLRGGDHRPFNDLGFAAIRLTEPNENYDWQHQNVREENGRAFGDRPDNVDFDYVKRVAQVNVAAVLEVALAPASPKNVRMDTTKLMPSTLLKWTANTEADLGGYAVLYRLTHEATWTHRRLVPKDQTQVTLENISKDDWLFAVEAVDAEGRRSLPVYPTPAGR